jgi:IMP cyclohydrolase
MLNVISINKEIKMPNLNAYISKADLEAGKRDLEENEYPGRIEGQGVSEDRESVVQFCALTGRSGPSRNREYVEEGGAVRTVAIGMTEEEMRAVPDADLIFYKVMDGANGIFVASNGAQTEPVLDYLQRHPVLEAAVRSAPIVKDVKGEEK